jgi:hypothetical protein
VLAAGESDHGQAPLREICEIFLNSPGFSRSPCAIAMVSSAIPCVAAPARPG